MRKNVGSLDRILRGVSALSLLSCSVLAPFSLTIRLLAFALPGAYLLLTAVAGSCVGYRALGKSTCLAVPDR
ncbi:MAG TPA: DUF2892 domain-containing protein [Polyangiaceae bacterium]|nr:DUF2892 domain-containing protein [Polyangiaceae bacterium]